MITFGYIAVILLGLIIGSFLNVVIYRLPLMMKREWHMQSCEILNQDIAWNEADISLAKPNSFCPQCKQPIKPWNNIPVLSFLLLRGRCQNCHNSIPWRYPFIEILSAVAAALCFWRFGYTWNMACLLVLSWGLIAASVIDTNEQFIPDIITIPLLWLGLLANTFFLFVPPQNAILGAIIGYLFFWCIAKLFYLVRGKEGLGYGDFKLIALFGAWIGLWPLLNIIIMSCILGIIVGVAFMAYKKINLGSQIPFGPFLALAGWCTIVFGDFITNAIIR
jgi:leader peptidase (prepilin peptidase)/N-methyltransferase